MKSLTRLLSLLAFALIAPLARAGDRFVVVPFSALEFEDSEAAPESGDTNAAHRFTRASVLFAPYVVLDTPGEVYLDFDPQTIWESWPGSPTRVALRVAADAPLAGRLLAPSSTSAGFAARRFCIASPPEDPSARSAFYGAMEAHYQRLLDASLPGAAWFRHQVAVSRAARGLAATEPEPGTALPWVAQRPGFDDTFDLFTGSRALAENLDLNRALRGMKSEEADIDVDSIEGVTTRAMDWKALIKDLEPELDPLAKLIPADQHALFFPSFEALMRVFDEVDQAGTPVLEFASVRAEDQRTKQRYQEQLCLPLSALGRLLGPTVVSSVAVTGSDPLLPSGTDVAVLFECKQAAVLEKYVMAQHLDAKSKGAAVIQGSVGTLKYGGVRSEDRRVCSVLAQSGDTLIVTNSLAQLERIAATLEGRAPALATADEYVWFRERYKRGDPSESGLLVLTDATIRRWAGPRARIGDSRRVRAAAAMAEIQARQLDALVAGTTAAGASAADTDLPFSADFVWGPRGVRSTEWGSLEFLTPVSELAIERVTPSEKQAYETFRQGFQSRWRNVFDPIALRLSFSDAKLAADLTVMPLVVSSEYREFRQLTEGAELAASAGDAHTNTLFHFALAFGKNSELGRMFSSGMGPFAQQLGADPLGWVGGGVALYADRDAFWDELLAARDRSTFMEEGFYRLPLALHVEVKDPLKLAGFLTALRAMVDGAAPSMTRWENKTWNEQVYVKIGVDENVDISDTISEAAIYYAALPDAFVLSLREDVVQRAIDRRIARKAGKVDPAREKPWLGSSVGLRVERDGVEAFAGLDSGGVDEQLRTATWSALPILNEWKRRYPDQEPVALHERLWGTRLGTAAGGAFAWNDALQTMEASDYGSPAAPKDGPRLPPAIERFLRAEFGLSFEGEGLRARVALERE